MCEKKHVALPIGNDPNPFTDSIVFVTTGVTMFQLSVRRFGMIGSLALAFQGLTALFSVSNMQDFRFCSSFCVFAYGCSFLWTESSPLFPAMSYPW